MIWPCRGSEKQLGHRAATDSACSSTQSNPRVRRRERTNSDSWSARSARWTIKTEHANRALQQQTLAARIAGLSRLGRPGANHSSGPTWGGRSRRAVQRAGAGRMPRPIMVHQPGRCAGHRRGSASGLPWEPSSRRSWRPDAARDPSRVHGDDHYRDEDNHYASDEKRRSGRRRTLIIRRPHNGDRSYRQAFERSTTTTTIQEENGLS